MSRTAARWALSLTHLICFFTVWSPQVTAAGHLAADQGLTRSLGNAAGTGEQTERLIPAMILLRFDIRRCLLTAP